MEGRAVSMAEHQCHAHTGEWLYAEVRKQLAFCGLESQLWVPGRTRMHERPHLNFCRFGVPPAIFAWFRSFRSPARSCSAETWPALCRNRMVPYRH
eukprot:scaffold115131_cov16-Tisochrysis_lutea.AAC.1